MQMSPLALFCEACGAANTTEATACFACHQPLQHAFSPWSAQPTVHPAAKVSLPATAPGHLLPGTLLNGRYRIVRQVGQGGFSVVYAAKDGQHKHKQVAIKQIDLCSLTPRQIIEATDTYNREVGLLSTLKHASLPHIHDHFTDQDHWYLVMDFIEGQTLEDYMQKAQKGYLPIKEALGMGIQLCRVLNVLHQQTPPIIFRDVKPANIMRTPKGRLHLIDFGIARHFSPGQRKDTGPLGTPGYAAPEQYGTAQTTIQTDIYGLGATLQTLLTGQDPLGSTSPPGHPLPQQLRQVVDRMLQRDASKRPQSVNEVQAELTWIKRGKLGAALSYVWGLLWASLPYPLLLLLLVCASAFPQIETIPTWHDVYMSLSILLLFVWPFVCVKHLIVAIRSLFSPPKRWMGLGMLTTLVLLAVAIIGAWLPLPLHVLPWYH